ncbi:Lsr2 family DNA-binding protein [Plantactinospora sp. DSM 117369]
MINWGSNEPGEFTGEWLLRRLSPIGLLVKNDAGLIELTKEAEIWLSEGGDEFLIGLIHSRIRFVGEALSEICAGARTHEELLDRATARYGVGWTSLDQVRRRTAWLRVGGFIERWSHYEVVPTACGLSLLEKLEIVDPASLPHAAAEDQVVNDIPPANGVIADILNSLDDEKLGARKRVIGFLPAGREGETLYESLRRLITFFSPSIEREEYQRICSAELGLSKSSAETALAALRSLGLVEQVGLDKFAPTPCAQLWLESAEPLDLIRIIHAHILMFGELVTLLPRPTDVGDLMSAVQAVLGDDSPQRSEIGVRLRLLSSCGLLVRVSHTSYMATPLGRALADELPCLQPDTDPAPTPESSAASVHSPMQEAVDELQAASVDSRDPKRFESAVHSALRLLGFGVRHLGGPGRTDILLSVWLGPGKQRRITVEVKSSGSGQVLEGAISFDAVEEHRVRHDADRAVIVGPSFPDGRLRKWAQQRNVRLIDVPTLRRYLELNEVAPLAPSALAGIFDIETAAPETAWDGVTRRQMLMRHVVATLWREANDDREVARSGGMLDVTALRYLLRDKLDPDPEEIQEVLSFLASPMMQTVGRKADKYYPLESPEITASKLRALGVEPGGRSAMRSIFDAGEQDGDLLDLEPPVAANDERNPLSFETSPAKVDAAAVRAWAAKAGVHVRDRGRLPSSVIKRYLDRRK